MKHFGTIACIKWQILSNFDQSKLFRVLSQEQSYFFSQKFSRFHCFLEDVELQSWKLIPIFKLPHSTFFYYSTNICTLWDCNWFLIFYSPYRVYNHDKLLVLWKSTRTILHNYPHNSEWKWNTPANRPGKSKKSSEIVDQSKMSCQKSVTFFYKKFSRFDFCFEDAMQNFNHGKLLTRKTSNERKHLVEIPIFKLPYHQRVFIIK